MFGKHLFPGGVHPREGANGKAVNSGNAIADMAAPARVVIPLSQHIGAPAKAVVKKGDHVLVGQLIGEAGGFVSAPVHATVSGTVDEIRPCLLASGMTVQAVVIDNDFKDEWVELKPSYHPESISMSEYQEILRNAGIVGMGGATFPTQVKVTPGPGKVMEKLLINGAECEPYLTADHRLMLEQSEAIIGIENNKPDAIAAMTKAAEGKSGIRVVGLPVCYPQGGEKQLIYALTRRQVPNGGLPIDVGVVVMNVGTVFAIDEAIRKGKPLVERVTTVGGLVKQPGNYRVRIGTPISLLLDHCGGLQDGVCKILSGGPMMGMAINDLEIPVTKGSSGILALGREAEEPAETVCIRCGRCQRACPMNLSPYLMDLYIRNAQYEEAEKLGVMNCIECGACTFVCPAKRMLTQSFKTGKRVIQTRRKAAADMEKKHQEQLAKEKADKEAAEKAAADTAAQKTNEPKADAPKEG